jgi:hypothetical protein
MGPGFRRESGSRNRQFIISIWILAQPRPPCCRHALKRSVGQDQHLAVAAAALGVGEGLFDVVDRVGGFDVGIDPRTCSLVRLAKPSPSMKALRLIPLAKAVRLITKSAPLIEP